MPHPMTSPAVPEAGVSINTIIPSKDARGLTAISRPKRPSILVSSERVPIVAVVPPRVFLPPGQPREFYIARRQPDADVSLGPIIEDLDLVVEYTARGGNGVVGAGGSGVLVDRGGCAVHDELAAVGGDAEARVADLKGPAGGEHQRRIRFSLTLAFPTFSVPTIYPLPTTELALGRGRGRRPLGGGGGIAIRVLVVRVDFRRAAHTDALVPLAGAAAHQIRMQLAAGPRPRCPACPCCPRSGRRSGGIGVQEVAQGRLGEIRGWGERTRRCSG